jgi:hypothetical protein
MSLYIIQNFNEDSSEIIKRSLYEAIVSVLEQYSVAIQCSFLDWW